MSVRYRIRDHVRDLAVGDLLEGVGAELSGVPEGSLLDVLGIELIAVGPGAARARMRVGPHHLNQSGFIQGGAVIALADAAAGWATYGLLDEPLTFTTLELKANLLRAAREGDILLASATPTHTGRTTCVLDVTVRLSEDGASDGRTMARFSCTQLVLGAK